MIIRRLDLDSLQPADLRARALANGSGGIYRTWVVESDRIVDLDALDADADMETQMAPYLTDLSADDSETLNRQATCFIGHKEPASGWSEPTSMSTNTSSHVKLSLLQSSDPLFADYTPHNANVWSITDDFLDLGDVVEHASASYNVIGWHADTASDDPLSDSSTTVRKRFETLSLTSSRFQEYLGTKQTDADRAFFEGNASLRTLCHGSIFDVIMTTTTRPDRSTADDAGTNLYTKHPVAIGPTAFDAMLATAQQYQGDKDVYGVLQRIRSIFSEELVAELDTVGDGCRPAHGGRHWFLTATDQDDTQQIAKVKAEANDSPPKIPSASDQLTLAQINDLQRALDEIGWTVKQRRWNLFAFWWKQATSSGPDQWVDPGGSADDIASIEKCIEDIKTQIKTLKTQLSADSRMSLRTRTNPRLYGPRDPTMFVAGLSSPWPLDWLKNLKTRSTQELATSAKAGAALLIQYPDDLLPSSMGLSPSAFIDTRHGSKGIGSIQSAVALLTKEFAYFAREVSDASKAGGQAGVPKLPSTGNAASPLYHDVDPRSGVIRDQWGSRQPFHPLFIEWQVRYYQLPFDTWSYKLGPGKDILGNAVFRPSWQVTTKGAAAIAIDPAGDQPADAYTYTGRILIQPQPGFSVRVAVERAFAATPKPELDHALPEEARKDLLDRIDRLPYLSAPLTGLYNQLATRLQGTHMTPTYRASNDSQAPVNVIQAVLGHTKYPESTFQKMGSETSLTPFGSEYDASGETGTSDGPSPFKPVVHGQFFFNKLIVVDRFGQAISALDESYDAPLQSVQTMISDVYAPQPDGGSVAPSVVQIPPVINQDVRLNAVFLTEPSPNEVGDRIWRPVTEWEDPVKGWLILNYVDDAIQLFLPDGIFYRELRVGNLASSSGQKWTPFDAPTPASSGSAPSAYLDQLAASLNSVDKFRSLMLSITQACDRLPHASTDYADSMTAIVGRPLAIVNIGVSLQLAGEPLANHSTINTRPALKRVEEYEFPVQLGDLRGFDGFIASFETDAEQVPENLDPPHSNQITICSHFPQSPSVSEGRPIPLRPYHAPLPTTTTPAVVGDLRDRHRREFKRRTILIDPFIDTHVVSGIVPRVKLKLPAWTVHTALRRMTAFFRLGPLLITSQAQPFNSGNELKSSDVAYLDKLVPPSIEHGKGIPIPALHTADWIWLQPTFTGNETKHNAVGLERLDNRPRFENGPYTIVDGYLQMKTSMDVAKPKPAKV